MERLITNKYLARVSDLGVARKLGAFGRARYDSHRRVDFMAYEEIGRSSDVLFLKNILMCPDLPATANNTLIVFLSDVHYGNDAITNRQKFSRLVDDVKSKIAEFEEAGIAPEKIILLLGGDYVNSGDRQKLTNRAIPETSRADVLECLDLLGELRRDKSFFGRGNHDNEHSMGEEIEDGLTERGFVCLNGDGVYLEDLGISVFGLPDTITQGDWYDDLDNIERANQWLDADQYTVAMAHDPTGLDQNIIPLRMRKVIGFGGHTHWGHYLAQGRGLLQKVANKIALRMIGFKSELVSGIHRRPNNVVINISSGIGDHPAFRIERTSMAGIKTPTITFSRTTPRMVNFTLLKSC